MSSSKDGLKRRGDRTGERRRLLEQVLSITDKLVQHALDESWSDLFEVVDRRRALLHSVQACGEWTETDSALQALTAAVTESEQAVSRVLAHALADASQAYWRSTVLH